MAEPMDKNDVWNSKSLEALPGACLVMTDEGVVINGNQRVLALLKTNSKSLINNSLAVIFPKLKAPQQATMLEHFLKNNAQNSDYREMTIIPNMVAKPPFAQDVSIKITLSSLLVAETHYVLACLEAQPLLELDDAQNLSHFESLFTSAPVPMMIYDAFGNISNINDSFMRTFGYQSEEIPNLLHWWNLAYSNEVYRHEVMRHWQQRLEMAKNSGEPFAKMSVHIDCKDGQSKEVIVSLSALGRPNNEEYLAVFIDITDHKKVCDDLVKNDQHLKRYLDQHPLAVMVIDRHQGTILEMNKKALAFYGYEASEIIGFSVDKLLANGSNNYHAKYYTQWHLPKLNRHSPASLQTHELANSDICQVEVYASLEKKQSNKLICMIYDVSERLQIESEKLKLEEKYQLLYEQNTNPIWAEDLSPVLARLKQLRLNGIQDLSAYLQEFPEELYGMADSIVINDVNSAALKLFSASNKSQMKTAITDTFGEGAIEVFKQELLAIWSGADSFQASAKFKAFDGRDINTILSIPLPKSASLFSDLPVSIIDITKVKQDKKELEFHSQILSSLSEGVYLISATDGKILYTNECFEKMFGYEPGEMLGQHVSIVNADSHVNAEEKGKEILGVLEQNGQWHGEVLNRRKDNSTFWCDASVSGYDHPQYGKIWISVHQDTTERKNYLQKIWYQANFDYLTQLPNREHFNEHIVSELEHLEQGGKGFALIFLDLDDFKEVNDTLGHNQGDALLIEVSARLQQSVRSQDVVGRFSGDEFMVLVRDMSEYDHSAVESIAEKILEAMQAPFYIKEQNVFVTLSLGIALCPTDSTALTTLVQYADQAMYHAKSMGKNQFSYFKPELQQQAIRNQSINRFLREAIEEQQIEVFFQPIVECETGIVHKAEALVRWQHEVLGFVSPAEFIPLAEHSLLIHALGDYVFNQSVEAVRAIKMTQGVDIQISVNKSPLQFINNPNDTHKTWPAVIKAANIPNDAICIEITEGVLLNMESKVTDKINTLINNEFSFSIDDFGTGYSALGYLNKIELDYLKIDQSFTQKIDIDEKNLALCEAIIIMAHKLGIKVIAEGVETEAQRVILQRIGCDYCQGYLFAKALAFNEFSEYVKQHQTSTIK